MQKRKLPLNIQAVCLWRVCQPFCEKTKISIRNSILISLLGISNQMPSPQSKRDLLHFLSLSLCFFHPLSWSLSLAWISWALPDTDQNPPPKTSSSPSAFCSNHSFCTINSLMPTRLFFDDPCHTLSAPPWSFPTSSISPALFIFTPPPLPPPPVPQNGLFCCPLPLSAYFPPALSAWCDH